MTIHDGIAETTLGITGQEVVANVEADALADKFTKHVYANGEMDVFGELVQAQSFSGGDLTVDILPTASTHIRHQTVRMSRAHAIELRDALDVLLRATSKAVPE